MPLHKFGRHSHSQRRIGYNVLKAEGKYTFTLPSAIVYDAFKISEVDTFVRLFINDVQVEKLDDLKK